MRVARRRADVPNAADLIARRLHAAGCRQAFGIPGGEVLTLVKALSEAGLEFILAKHENAAGFMAEGTYHASGAPGVLVATLGPGVANAVNVVANAEQDRVPLIFLTGCVDPVEALTYSHQVFDHRELLRSVTKASFTVPRNGAGVVIDKALAIAFDDPRGPVHIDLPIDVAESPATDAAPQRTPAVRGRPTDAALTTARRWFGEAQRPLMIAGVDALNHGAEAVVAAAVDRFGVPLITTYKAKGIVPEDQELSLGAAGLSPKADSVLLPLLAQSDLIVLAGYDPIEMRSGWRDPWPARARVVEFCAVPNTHYVHQAQQSFVGDVGAGLAALVEDIAPGDPWPGGEPASARRALEKAFPRGAPWGPAAVIDTARAVLPRDTVATVDSGAHRILLSQMWRCYNPRTLLQSTGLCTMGCALPLGIGYKYVDRNRPLAVFSGDAGLEMVLGELATLRDLALPLILIVFVDASLALIELKQRARQHGSVGVDFPTTDFVGVARAMGLHGAWADDRGSLAKAIEDALGRRGATLIGCRIDRRSYDGTF